jgi:hypothetical protein
MRRIGFAVVVAVSFIIGSSASCAEAGDDGELRSMVRAAGLVPYWTFKTVKDFSYPEVGAARLVSIRDFSGKVVVVNLWATWCLGPSFRCFCWFSRRPRPLEPT